MAFRVCFEFSGDLEKFEYLWFPCAHPDRMVTYLHEHEHRGKKKTKTRRRRKKTHEIIALKMLNGHTKCMSNRLNEQQLTRIRENVTCTRYKFDGEHPTKQRILLPRATRTRPPVRLLASQPGQPALGALAATNSAPAK